MKIAMFTAGDPIALAIVADLKACHVVRHYQEEITVLQSLLRPLKRRQHKLTTRVSRMASLLVFGLLYKIKIERRLTSYCQITDVSDPDLVVRNINSHDVYTEVLRFKPDLIITIGVSVLKKQWTELDMPIINLHTGLLPLYRGRFCWFWPILDRKTEALGVSVHRLVSAIDAGEVYAFSPLSFRHQHEDALVNLFLSLADAHTTALHIFLHSEVKHSQAPEIDSNHRIKFEPRITELTRGLYRLKKLSTHKVVGSSIRTRRD